MKKIYIIAGVVIIIGIIISFGLLNSKGKLIDAKNVSRETAYITVKTTGLVTSDSLASLSANTSGILSEAYIKAGSFVNKGDILALFNNDKQKYALKEAELNVENANNKFIGIKGKDLKDAQENLTQAQLTANNAKYLYETAKRVYDEKSNVAVLDEAINKAQIDYNEAEKDYNDKLKLFEINAISQSELDSAKNIAMVKLSMLNSAKAARNNFIDDSELIKAKNSYDLALSSLRKAQNDVNALGETGTVYINAVSAIEHAKNNLEKAQNDLKDTQIVAPFDGTIVKSNAIIGEFVSIGKEMFVITKTNDIYIKADIDEKLIPLIKVLQKAFLLTESDKNNKISASVSEILPLVNNENGTFTIKLAVENPNNLLINMSTNIEIITQEIPNQIVLSKNYLIYNNGSYVATVANNKVKFVSIEISQDLGDSVIVNSGISENDIIISPNNIKEGDKVRPIIK